MQALRGVEEDADGRRADGRDARKRLDEAVDAQKMPFGHEQRKRGHEGGAVERLTDAARHDERHERRERHLSDEQRDADAERHDADAEVGGHHDGLAVATVRDDAAEGGDEPLGQVGADACGREHEGAAGCLGDVPDDGPAGCVAGDHRKRLSCEDDGDDGEPPLRQRASGCAQGREGFVHGKAPLQVTFRRFQSCGCGGGCSTYSGWKCGRERESARCAAQSARKGGLRGGC